MRTLGDIFERSCHGKRQHSEQEAKAEVRRMEWLEKTKFKYYLCDCCGRYHVAHQERKHA